MSLPDCQLATGGGAFVEAFANERTGSVREKPRGRRRGAAAGSPDEVECPQLTPAWELKSVPGAILLRAPPGLACPCFHGALPDQVFEAGGDLERTARVGRIALSWGRRGACSPFRRRWHALRHCRGSHSRRVDLQLTRDQSRRGRAVGLSHLTAQRVPMVKLTGSTASEAQIARPTRRHLAALPTLGLLSRLDSPR